MTSKQFQLPLLKREMVKNNSLLVLLLLLVSFGMNPLYNGKYNDYETNILHSWKWYSSAFLFFFFCFFVFFSFAFCSTKRMFYVVENGNLMLSFSFPFAFLFCFFLFYAFCSTKRMFYVVDNGNLMLIFSCSSLVLLFLLFLLFSFSLFVFLVFLLFLPLTAFSCTPSRCHPPATPAHSFPIQK